MFCSCFSFMVLIKFLLLKVECSSQKSISDELICHNIFLNYNIISMNEMKYRYQ